MIAAVVIGGRHILFRFSISAVSQSLAGPAPVPALRWLNKGWSGPDQSCHTMQSWLHGSRHNLLALTPHFNKVDTLQAPPRARSCWRRMEASWHRHRHHHRASRLGDCGSHLTTVQFLCRPTAASPHLSGSPQLLGSQLEAITSREPRYITHTHHMGAHTGWMGADHAEGLHSQIQATYLRGFC